MCHRGCCALKKQGVAEEVVIFTVRKNEKSTKDQMITAMAKGADRAVVVDDADFNGAIAGIQEYWLLWLKKKVSKFCFVVSNRWMG